ncbi:MAG: TetR family transcriptional regulator [Gammaproteobacteria bacterium]|nr:TetR family transcriptional regulator [Gammaproteobacteria bacterium]
MAAGNQAIDVNTDNENTRELILRIAALAFAENGYSGTSLRDIGEQAGINFQSIRYHFGSKEDLWEIVVATLSRKALEAGMHHEQAIAGLPLKEQLHAQIRALVSYQVTNPELMFILTREAMKKSERYKNIYPKYVSNLYEFTGKFFGRLQKEGIINNEIPVKELVLLFRGAMIFRLITSVDGEFYTKKSIKPDVLIEQHADGLTKLLLTS